MLKRIFFVVMIGVLVLFSHRCAFADININLVAVNATDEAKESPVKYYLPQELAPEDIVDRAGLELDYDMDKSSYYVHGNIELKPKETVTFKIKVKDVWRIKEEEVSILKKQINDNVAFLENSDFYEPATLLRDDMFRKLDYVMTQQQNYSENIERRIEEYRSYLEVVNEIRKNAFSGEYFQQTNPPPVREGTITFMVDAENTSSTETKTVLQKHYLPFEIKSEHIVQAESFQFRYDEGKQQPYLYAEDEFAPKEKRRHKIVIRDTWQINQSEVENLKRRAERVHAQLQETEYEESANFLLANITENITKILNSKLDRSDMKNYVGTYRTNLTRFKSAEDDIEKLEKILSLLKAKQLQEMEQSSVKNVLQKLKALRGIAALSKAIFGKKPTVNTTWRIIWGIMAFIAFFTGIHFFTWWKRSKIMGEEQAPSGGGKIEEVKDEAEKSMEEEMAEQTTY